MLSRMEFSAIAARLKVAKLIDQDVILALIETIVVDAPQFLSLVVPLDAVAEMHDIVAQVYAAQAVPEQVALIEISFVCLVHEEALGTGGTGTSVAHLPYPLEMALAKDSIAVESGAELESLP